MQIKKSPKINKPIAITIAVVLLLVIASLAYIFVFKPSSNSTNTTPTKDLNTDKQQSDAIKSDPNTKNDTPNADKPAEPTTNNSSSKKQVQVTASSDMSNGTVYIRGGVNYPVSDGTCYAQLSGPSGQSIRKNTSLLQNPASTDCKTISIPASELATGMWTFTLHYTSDTYEGISSEVSFSV